MPTLRPHLPAIDQSFLLLELKQQQQISFLCRIITWPSWHSPSDRPPPGSHIPAIDEDVLDCKRQSTAPALAATPPPSHNLECKCLRISPPSRAAPRTRCPTPAPVRPCSPPPPPRVASP